MAKIILTNHLKQRIYERKISESLIYQTIESPDDNKKVGDRIEFRKKNGFQTLTVVTKLNQSGEYLVLSAWIDPPNPGTHDEKKKERYLEMKKAGPIKKLFLTFLNQLGM